MLFWISSDSLPQTPWNWQTCLHTSALPQQQLTLCISWNHKSKIIMLFLLLLHPHIMLNAINCTGVKGLKNPGALVFFCSLQISFVSGYCYIMWSVQWLCGSQKGIVKQQMFDTEQYHFTSSAISTLLVLMQVFLPPIKKQCLHLCLFCVFLIVLKLHFVQIPL